jgi:hypothetical protein
MKVEEFSVDEVIASLNVALTDTFLATSFAELVGTVDTTVGAGPAGSVGVSPPQAVTRTSADASHRVERVIFFRTPMSRICYRVM